MLVVKGNEGAVVGERPVISFGSRSVRGGVGIDLFGIAADCLTRRVAVFLGRCYLKPEFSHVGIISGPFIIRFVAAQLDEGNFDRSLGVFTFFLGEQLFLLLSLSYMPISLRLLGWEKIFQLI